MKAVISACGRQYKVREGDLVNLDLQDAKPGDSVECSNVLLVEEGEQVHIGQPLLPDAKVVLRVVDETKGKKLRIFKHKRRKNHRKTNGHRQKYTQVKVESIAVNG